MKYKKVKVYALYKGEINLCDGTLKEIALKMNKPVETIRFYASKIYKKRRKDSIDNNYLELVEIEDEFVYEKR